MLSDNFYTLCLVVLCYSDWFAVWHFAISSAVVSFEEGGTVLNNTLAWRSEHQAGRGIDTHCVP